MMKKTKKHKKYYWGENYDVSSKQPYGTYILSELLENHFPKESFYKIREPLEFVFEDIVDSSQVSNYVFVGEEVYMNDLDEIALLDFVERGNKAFFMVSAPWEWLSNGRFFYSEVFLGNYNVNTWEIEGKADSIDLLFSSVRTDSVTLHFYDDSSEDKRSYDYTYWRQNVPKNYFWLYFQQNLLLDTNSLIRPLAYLQADSSEIPNTPLLNYMAINYGQGTFYLHTTPLAFTNIHLLDSLHLVYTEKVFAHLAEGPIYWDEYSKVSGTGGNNDMAESPLSFILSQPPLRWAWYLLLATILLYVLFRAKRRQRMIPVLAQRENSSLDYVKTIGTLYFQQANHQKLAQQKMKLFLGFLHFRYRLPTKTVDETLIQKIIEKSQVEASRVQAIFNQFEQINQQQSLSSHSLIRFHEVIAHFYEHCK